MTLLHAQARLRDAATGDLLGGAELAGRVSEVAKELADLPSCSSGSAWT